MRCSQLLKSKNLHAHASGVLHPIVPHGPPRCLPRYDLDENLQSTTRSDVAIADRKLHGDRNIGVRAKNLSMHS
jgi:hypothetical protein